MKRFFCLPPLPTVLIALPSFVLVTYVLFKQIDDWLSYFAYAASAYALIISLTSLFRLTRWAIQSLKKMPLAQRLLSQTWVQNLGRDVGFRTQVSLGIGLLADLLFIVLELALGVYYRSVWFVSLAVYYIMLALMRYALLRPIREQDDRQRKQLGRYRLCGYMLLLLNWALAGIVILCVEQNYGYEYQGNLIYAIASYSFYAVIIASVRIIQFRKYANPILSAAKVINLTAALVSLLALETAMLAQFGGQENPLTRRIITAATGGGVCSIVLAMAVFMIATSSSRIKKINTNIEEINPNSLNIRKEVFAMPQETFNYTYSAPQQEEIKQIRQKYAPATPMESQMERLRRLDRAATRPGAITAFTVGVLSALLFGLGMCCTMLWANTLFVPGVVIGVLGLSGMATVYPLYAHITKKQRNRLAPEILQLTDELMEK